MRGKGQDISRFHVGKSWPQPIPDRSNRKRKLRDTSSKITESPPNFWPLIHFRPRKMGRTCNSRPNVESFSSEGSSRELSKPNFVIFSVICSQFSPDLTNELGSNAEISHLELKCDQEYWDILLVILVNVVTSFASSASTNDVALNLSKCMHVTMPLNVDTFRWRFLNVPEFFCVLDSLLWVLSNRAS